MPTTESVTSSPIPNFWLMRDCMFDAQGKEVHMFWEAVSHDSNQLPGPMTNVPTDPTFYLTHVVRTFPRATSTPSKLTVMPDRVTMRVRLVPVGFDVLDNLVSSGRFRSGGEGQDDHVQSRRHGAGVDGSGSDHHQVRGAGVAGAVCVVGPLGRGRIGQPGAGAHDVRAVRWEAIQRSAEQFRAGRAIDAHKALARLR